jgi:hypothetical protein
MSSAAIQPRHQSGFRVWKPAFLYAVPISLSVLGLFYYWYAVADRYAIFLYEHLGATPFDKITGSRYWMAGLVACGAVMCLYTITTWLLGQVAALQHQNYTPPTWWHVWLLSASPLIIGIPTITMTFNQPTLPFPYAIACLVTTLVGLAFALAPGSLAAQRPSDLGWLVLDGLGLMPALLLLRAIELPNRGLVGVPLAYIVAIGSILGGAVWLGTMTGLRAWRHRSWPTASALFVAGLCLSYLLMPLVHHLFFTPRDYRYISTSSNFFAFNFGIQLMVFFVAGILAVGFTRLRGKYLPSLSNSPRFPDRYG